MQEVIITSAFLMIVSYFCLKIIDRGLPSTDTEKKMILMEEVSADQECDMKRKSALFAQHVENYHLESLFANSSNTTLRRNARKIVLVSVLRSLHQYLQRRLGQ